LGALDNKSNGNVWFGLATQDVAVDTTEGLRERTE